ncbi:hypothetical protein DH2020_030394 [Rehmannia glutinosa]|uniref:Uncharacterized protein n=1 Tax=Rehmannia glutinosa TaxID=99300 RepID=A0ABR0VLU5_REHGL
MESGIACCARGAILPNVSSQQYSNSLAPSRAVSPFLSSKSLTASSLFGESLRIAPKSSLKVSKAKNSSLVTKCEIGDSLVSSPEKHNEEFLAKSTSDKGLITLMISMGEALRTIAFKVRTASCGGTACVNSFGDEQLAVDMLADKLLFELTGVTGADQVAAAMGIFGPRTTYVLALKDIPGTHEFLLLDEGKWQHVKDTTSIGEGKMFSPGNLRATSDNADYAKLIDYYVREKYTLRYTGGMVPDVNQIIVKEKGIFTNVASPSAKAKLRLLFEVAPLGFLIEKAGGYSSDGKQSVLDKVINNLDDRTQVAYGSKNEIIRFEETLYGSSRLKYIPYEDSSKTAVLFLFSYYIEALCENIVQGHGKDEGRDGKVKQAYMLTHISLYGDWHLNRVYSFTKMLPSEKMANPQKIIQETEHLKK